MDVLRDTLWNAEQSGLTFHDVLECAAYADTIEAFDTAVNELALATYRPDLLALVLEAKE